MSEEDAGLPQIIPYDGPDSDLENVGPVPLTDSLLRPVSWGEISTLNGRSTVLGSPWGEYYKLEYETDDQWDKSYKISQAMKKIEDVAEKFREMAGGSFVGVHQAPATSLFGSGTGFGAARPAGLICGGLPRPYTPIDIFGSQPSFGASASTTTGGRTGMGGLFGTRGSAAMSTPSARGIRIAAIESYAVIGARYYPPAAVDGMVLQDWFVGGNDQLENSQIEDIKKTETLRNLLFAISMPGFEAMLSVKLVNVRKSDILKVSCACAYALKILHRQGNEYFNFVLAHAPPSVLLEVSLFARGTLIDTTIEHKVLQAAAIRLTTPEPKDVKEVVHARAIAVMVARILDCCYKEAVGASSEAQRASTLAKRVSALMEDACNAPVDPPPSRRSIITAIAALCALLLAGALTFADELQQRSDKNRERAELAVSAVLSCIGFAAPVPYLAAASGLVATLGIAIVRHIWKPKDPGLKSALVIQTLQMVQWPLIRRREVLRVGLVELSFEEASEFKMFFELTLQSAWVGYWHLS